LGAKRFKITSRSILASSCASVSRCVGAAELAFCAYPTPRQQQQYRNHPDHPDHREVLIACVLRAPSAVQQQYGKFLCGFDVPAMVTDLPAGGHCPPSDCRQTLMQAVLPLPLQGEGLKNFVSSLAGDAHHNHGCWAN
jgi:hypothetical protein